INGAGNTSGPSNTVTVAFASTAADYNGINFSDAALYRPGSATNDGQYVVQTATIYTQVSFTGVLANASTSVTGLSTTTGLAVGDTVTGTGIPAGTRIVALNSSAATLTLSARATASGSQSLTVTPPSPWFGPSGQPTPWGPASSIPFVGDFDGDNQTDLAIY